MLRRKCDLISGAQSLTGKILSPNDLARREADSGFVMGSMEDLEISVTVAVNIFERKSVEKMEWLRELEMATRQAKSLGVICIVPAPSTGSGQALRKGREERSTRLFGTAGEIKSLGHPPL